jgi:hypothetical protein
MKARPTGGRPGKRATRRPLHPLHSPKVHDILLGCDPILPQQRLPGGGTPSNAVGFGRACSAWRCFCCLAPAIRFSSEMIWR